MTEMSRLRTLTRVVAAAALIAAGVSCGDVSRTGRSPVYLVINSLTAAPGGGAGAGVFTGTLHSDVQVIVQAPAPPCPCPTIFSDSAQAILSLALKDIGTTTSPNTPTSNNQVTITRVHIEYVRADGRNTPGVDVPYAFDGAVTATVPATGTAQLGFEIVRHVAKEESPLVQLTNSASVITTICKVTFFGTDQVGNEVSVMGQIQIDFGNFGDT
jgi:hypothetical protein